MRVLRCCICESASPKGGHRPSVRQGEKFPSHPYCGRARILSMYKPRPIIVWKLRKEDSSRIACHCGAPARYGRTADGGTPYFYECSKHIPTGKEVLMVSNTQHLIAAVAQRSEVKASKTE